jgi:hypothetical protein
MEWANWKASRGEYARPAVVGAVIDLRHCLDLVSRWDLDLVRAAHRSFTHFQKRSGLPIPKNRSAPGQPDADRVLRYLDCAVLKHLHSILDAQAADDRLYPGSGIRRKSHTQIAVRNDACIQGLFWPRMQLG